VLGIVLAGGAGKRLAPLTADRAKPAVPFAGLYRLVDFALSNLVNAGILRVAVLTQYKSHSLDRVAPGSPSRPSRCHGWTPPRSA
jgi:glucose-1-phosphate adenylyltransferase